MAFDFDVTGNTKLDTSGFTNGISSMTVAAGNLIADFVKSASRKMAELVTSSVDIGASFETALAKVSTIADTSKVSVGDLNKQILDTSGSMGVAAADIAEAAYQAISAGQDTANAVAFAGQASKLAAAGFTSSSSAVDILTTALNAYGLSADQATHVSDVLLTTQNLGKTSVDELSSSMGKVIPLAAAYGVTVENLSSGLAVMTANGIATAEATTYTKSMLNELGDAGSTVGKILQKQTGKSFAQLNAEGKSLGDVLQILYQSVGGSSTAFAGLWSSVEAGTGALSLASGGAEHFNDVLSQMQNSAGATETAYETMTDTFQHKVETMQTAAQNFGITLYDSLESSLSDATQWGTDCLTQLTTALSEGGPEAMLAAAGEIISELAAGIAEQLPGLMTTGVEIITQLAQNLTDTMPAMLDTGAEVLAALAQGIINATPALLTSATEIIAEFMLYLGDHADEIMDTGMQLLESLVIGITDNLPQLITAAAALIAKWAAALIAHLPDILKCGAAMLTTLVDGIVCSLENLAEAALACVAKLVGVWDGSMDEWGHIGENIVSGLLNGIKGAWNSLTKWVSNGINGLVSGVKGRLGIHSPSKVFDEIGVQVCNGLAQGLDRGNKKVKDAAKTVVASVTDSTTTLTNGVAKTVETVTERMANGATQQKQTITETSRQMVGGVLKDIKTVTSIAADGTKTVKQTMETVRETAKTVTSTFETLADGVKTTTQTVTETLTDGTETQKQVITEVYDDVVDGALVTVEKIKTVAADGTVQVAEQIKKSSADTFDGLWKELQDSANTGVLGTFDDLYTAVKNQDWLSVGKWVASTIYGGLTADQKKQVNDFALGIVTKLNKALGGARDQLVQGAIDLGGQIVNGLTSGFSEVWQQAQGLGSTLIEIFGGLKTPLSNAALAISQGMKGGLISAFPEILASLGGLIGSIGGAFVAMLDAIAAALFPTGFGTPQALLMIAAGVALAAVIAGIVASIGGSFSKKGSSGRGGSSGGSSGSGGMGSVDITTGTGSLEDAINANTKALEKTNSALADMIRQAGALVLSDNMRLGSTVAASGTAQVVSAANSYHREGDTNITQNFYNGHDTAAAQQREARWEADKAKARKR